MNLRTKGVSDLVAADIDSLLTNRVEEGVQLDFKSALVGGTNDDRKKFLADICAFANAQGGDLVLGMLEDSIGAAGEVMAGASVVQARPQTIQIYLPGGETSRGRRCTN